MILNARMDKAIARNRRKLMFKQDKYKIHAESWKRI